MATRAHTVQLHPAAYGAFESEAIRRHLAPDELPDELVRGQLVEVHAQRARMGDTLAALEEISARVPEVDAVRLVREGRNELTRRSA